MQVEKKHVGFHHVDVFVALVVSFSSQAQDTFTFTTTPRGAGSPCDSPTDAGASSTVVFEVPSFEILSIGQDGSWDGNWE